MLHVLLVLILAWIAGVIVRHELDEYQKRKFNEMMKLYLDEQRKLQPGHRNDILLNRTDVHYEYDEDRFISK